MSEETGKANKFEKVDAIRERLNRLHSERGSAVVVAKDFRHGHGITSETFKRSWNVVEKLTGQIEQAQRELDAAMRDQRLCTIDSVLLGQLVGALDEIRCMPVFDAEAGGRLDQLNGQYEEARETARIAVKAWLHAAEVERGQVCNEILAEMDAEVANG